MAYLRRVARKVDAAHAFQSRDWRSGFLPEIHDPKRARGVLRARNLVGNVIKGEVDESTFARISHWIKCQV